MTGHVDHDDYVSGECASCSKPILEGQFYQDADGERYHLACKPQDEPQPQVELTADDLIRMAFPPPIQCSNHCDHGCDLPMEPGQNWVKVALDAGWTVMRWVTDHNDYRPGHNDHVMAFCDPGCAYTHMRARMLSDSHWRPLLSQMDWEAIAKSEEIQDARAEHEHGHSH